MIELSKPCMLMEGEKILGIYVDNFFPKHKCPKWYDLLDFTYKHRRFVEQGKEKAGGNMVMIGWQHDKFIDKPTM